MTPPPRGGRSAGSDAWIAARRRKRRRNRMKHRRKRTALVVAVFIVVPLVVLVAAGIGGTAAFRASCDLDALRPVGIGQNSFVYAADGSVLGAIPAERNRTPVSRSEISPWMPAATIAIEDRRFYQHGGVDYEGIFRALVADIRAGKVVQGGSTITQQLVRNLYISKEKTVKRKVVEACLAIKLSRHWSKNRILTAYMNQVYYGNHAYGIEAAAETYFSKSAKELTLAEAALLAGLPQAPSVYDPFHRPADALRRRDDVLRAMLANGAITSTQYVDSLEQRNLHLKAGRRYTRIREPYFFTYVEDQLQQEYGANTVRSGGLKVYTTIDPRLQRAANSAIKRVLYYSSDPSSAIVAIDPRNGAIRAMTAVTPGRKGNKFNLVSQARRQPGSTFKVVVLTTAVSLGINPSTTQYLSAPLHYQPDPTCNASDPNCAWDVQTYDHTYLGTTSIENATVHSDNTVFARLILDVGPGKVVKMAYRLAPGARRLRRRGVHGDPGARAEHASRHRRRRLFRPHLGGQDGDDRQLRRRVVLRLRAAARGHRLDRLSEGGDPDAERARDRGLRTDVPCADLALLHGVGDRQRAGARLRGAEGGAGVGAVPRPVRVRRRVGRLLVVLGEREPGSRGDDRGHCARTGADDRDGRVLARSGTGTGYRAGADDRSRPASASTADRGAAAHLAARGPGGDALNQGS